MISIRERLFRVFVWMIAILMMIVTVYIATVALIFRFDSGNSIEKVANIGIQVAMLLLLMTLFFFLYKKEKLNVKTVALLDLFSLLVAISFVLILGFRYTGQLKVLLGSDSLACFKIAEWFLNCDYRAVVPTDSYLSLWPFQTGWIFILEKMMRIFNTTDPLFFQRVNVIYICIMIVAGYGIIRHFTTKFIPVLAYFLLVCTYCPLLLRVYDVYGDIPALSLMVCASFFFLKLQNEKRKLLMLFESLFFVFLCGLAGAYKGQTRILGIALFLAAFLGVIRNGRWIVIIVATMGMIATVFSPKITQAYYEYYAHNECGKGVPASAYLAMGMQWNGEEAIPGGWNGYHSALYMDNDYDYAVTDSLSRESIKDALKEFSNNPSFALKFYYKKTMKQWANETHGVFWSINDVYDVHRNSEDYWVRFVEWKIYEKWLSFMDCHETILYFVLLFSVIKVIKEMVQKNYSVSIMGPILFFIGGFLFSVIWEGQTGAVLYYPMCLLPFSLGAMNFGRIRE